MKLVPNRCTLYQQVHTVDQVLSFTSGTAKAIIAGEEKDVQSGDIVIVPAGVKHNFINSGPTPLMLYTGMLALESSLLLVKVLIAPCDSLRPGRAQREV